MANPIVTSLPLFVEQNKIGLLANSVLGARTASIINYQTGIKSVAAINLLGTDVEFGDGSDCGWDAAGSQEMSQRLIETGMIKINMPYCEKKLLKTWAQYGVRIAAGQKTLPFEEDFVNAVVANVKAELEKAIWQGDKSSLNENLNKFDGFIKLIGAAEGVVTVSAAKSDVFKAIQDVIKAIPTTALKEDTKVFVGTDTFVAFTQALVDKNLYHYSGENSNFEYTFPATTIKVVAVDGLNGTDKMYAGRASNFYYGTDMEGDEEKFDLWYSKDNQEFRLAIEFNAGVQVAFPNEIVAATLVAETTEPDTPTEPEPETPTEPEGE